MCGIIGIWAKNNIGKETIPLLPQALSTHKHRGPDHQDCKLYSKCGLGHTRLSVIDTDARSNQPFVSDDGRFTLVFNGEIYNYQELMEGLLTKGLNLVTLSDTEVLFYLLINEGEAALKKLNGFFALAFYDKQKETVLLAREKMGIKPLYIYEDSNQVTFASELYSFKKLELPLRINNSALNFYFGFTYFVEKNTVYKNVVKLNPGEFIVFKEGTKQSGNVKGLSKEKSNLSYQKATHELTNLITKCG